jgi:hypothetical protein
MYIPAQLVSDEVNVLQKKGQKCLYVDSRANEALLRWITVDLILAFVVFLLYLYHHHHYKIVRTYICFS